MAKKIASISKSRNGQFYSEMLTGGKTVHTSETYTRKDKAVKGVVSTVNNILNAIASNHDILHAFITQVYNLPKVKLTAKDLAPLIKDLTAPKSGKAATSKGGKKSTGKLKPKTLPKKTGVRGNGSW